MIVNYEVGKPFPNDRYRAKQGGIVMMNSQGFDIVILLRGISGEEATKFVKTELVYGIVVEKTVPFLVVKLDRLVDLDVSFNVKGFRRVEDRKTWLHSESNLVNLYLVDADSFILKGIRSIGINLELAARIKEVCIEQENRYGNKADVDQAISMVVNKFSQKEMIANIEKRYKL